MEKVKQLHKEGHGIHAENDSALSRTAQNGHLEIVKYLVENGANIHADDEQALCFTAYNGYLDIVKYLIDNGADTSQIGGIDRYKEEFKQIDKWETKHGNCPSGLYESSPHYFKLKPFNDVVKILNQEGYKNKEANQYAYKNGAKYPELSALCFENDWDDDDFENAVEHVIQYQKKYIANDNQKPDSRIPDIKIDGDEFDKAGYSFYKLPDGDIRGLFLGEMTNCCQHLAGLGEECASHGYLSKDSGFYVVEDKETRQIIAQTWAWRGKKDELVLDSLESLSGHFNKIQWEDLCMKIVSEIYEQKTDITQLNIGKGGATPELCFNTATCAFPEGYDGYRDSHEQYSVWKNPNNSNR